jgi:hypothetical protein
MVRIQDGDIVVSKLPLDYGYVFGRVSPGGGSPRWDFLGCAGDRAKACDAACRFATPAQTVWLFDAYDRYVPCGSAGCDVTDQTG